MTELLERCTAMQDATSEVNPTQASDATSDEASPPSSSCGADRGALIDGRYRLLERLGSGGVGVVYKAEDIWLRRHSALKVIAPSYENDPRIVESLQKEARALALIRHEHVVQVYTFGPLGRSFYLAMEFACGKNLDELLVELRVRLDTERALAIVRQIARGLAVAHTM